ncbi:type I inositol 1,4,5-trisphosphate 5-phosphatase 1-like [Dorcoceras hygrometricum]|uniref:Type I inositol 1,4,5-trisphosphate 5-phosphatase 1-like n=1 Tax=Dorcoceras hygrometricum TaxID=472368 RepID=A0A2Z7C759_9LAMI|nr:type I inositol 1,4,5-trisphosphate 5-phosphatase 1-like [Dorcoceras hygrometricum]
MQMLCMRHRITTEGSTNKGAKELKHSSKNPQQQWPRGVFTMCARWLTIPAGRGECGIAARPRILVRINNSNTRYKAAKYDTQGI